MLKSGLKIFNVGVFYSCLHSRKIGNLGLTNLKRRWLKE